MKNTGEIVDWIESRSQSIVSNINFESVDVYKFLRAQFLTSNIEENYLFQFVYRSFYRLDNAGLTADLKREYFKILEENRNNDSYDFESALKRLYTFENHKGQNTVQFSFITKLFNTINNNMPIYDNEVAEVFNMTQPYYCKGFEKKLSKYMAQFELIGKAYSEVLEFNLLPLTTTEFDKRFQNHGLTEMKRLDFIFWSAGKIKSSKALVNKKSFV